MTTVAKEITVDDGTRIYAEIRGSGGPTLVFIAGLGGDRRTWDLQVERLSGRFRIVTIDNRGSGNSSTPPGPYSTKRMADDAHCVLAALGLGQVTAVGISMGGAICQHWALRYPADIERVVLSNTWSGSDVLTGALFDHWRHLAERGEHRLLSESLLLFCYSPDYLNLRPETVLDFVGGRNLHLPGIVSSAMACRGHDIQDSVSAIRQPALVIAGANDILIRPKLSEELAQRLPNARYEVLPTGHMPNWETPDEYNELVAAFAAD